MAINSPIDRKLRRIMNGNTIKIDLFRIETINHVYRHNWAGLTKDDNPFLTKPLSTHSSGLFRKLNSRENRAITRPLVFPDSKNPSHFCPGRMLGFDQFSLAQCRVRRHSFARETPNRYLVPRASRESPPRIEGAAQAAVPLSHRIADERPCPAAAILQQSLPSMIDKHENMLSQHATSFRKQACETAAAIAPLPPAIHPPSNGSLGECKPRRLMDRA